MRRVALCGRSDSPAPAARVPSPARVADRPHTLTPATQRRLRALLERTRRREADYQAALDELAQATLAAVEQEGVSRRTIAAALGVGASTVQGWVSRARRARG